MAGAIEPSQRPMSSNPTGAWLADLRTSFEPGHGKQQGGSPKLFGGRFGSA